MSLMSIFSPPQKRGTSRTLKLGGVEYILEVSLYKGEHQYYVYKTNARVRSTGVNYEEKNWTTKHREAFELQAWIVESEMELKESGYLVEKLAIRIESMKKMREERAREISKYVAELKSICDL